MSDDIKRSVLYCVQRRQGRGRRWYNEGPAMPLSMAQKDRARFEREGWQTRLLGIAIYSNECGGERSSRHVHYVYY